MPAQPPEPNDKRTTLEKSADWVRDLEAAQSQPKRYVPRRTWTYYLAIVIALLMLICAVTGMGTIILTKGQKVMQRYIERLYGLAPSDSEPSR